MGMYKTFFFLYDKLSESFVFTLTVAKLVIYN